MKHLKVMLQQLWAALSHGQWFVTSHRHSLKSVLKRQTQWKSKLPAQQDWSNAPRKPDVWAESILRGSQLSLAFSLSLQEHRHEGHAEAESRPSPACPHICTCSAGWEILQSSRILSPPVTSRWLDMPRAKLLPALH